MNKEYLGDSVYVELLGYGFQLTTENGFGPSNTIVLEPEVYNSLVNYLERQRKRGENLTSVALDQGDGEDEAQAICAVPGLLEAVRGALDLIYAQHSCTGWRGESDETLRAIAKLREPPDLTPMAARTTLSLRAILARADGQEVTQ